MLGRAELAHWVQHVPGASALEAVFFRNVAMPAGTVQSRRPPRETVLELTKQIAATPSRADLVSLRAHEAELNLDFTMAEQDWKTYARLAADKAEGSITLADYYHRRLQPNAELAALLEAAAQPASGRDGLNPTMDQRSWKLFVRATGLANAQFFPRIISRSTMRGSRASRRSPIRTRDSLIPWRARQTQRAQQLIDRYAKAFPSDEAFPMQARARLLASGRGAQVIRAELSSGAACQRGRAVFSFAERTRNLRTFWRAQAAAAVNPNDLNAAARLFYYYQQQGNLPQAHRALIEYRMRRGQPTPSELLALATLFEQTNNFGEAAQLVSTGFPALRGPKESRGMPD